MLTKAREAVVKWAIVFMVLTLILAGCAGGGETLKETGGETLPQQVTTEYLLVKAGFQKWDVNQDTPRRQALLAALPEGQISTYQRDGQTYHVYTDVGSNKLYIGDEAAYQRYQSLAGKRNVCRQATGPNQEKFWKCMEEASPAIGGGR